MLYLVDKFARGETLSDSEHAVALYSSLIQRSGPKGTWILTKRAKEMLIKGDIEKARGLLQEEVKKATPGTWVPVPPELAEIVGKDADGILKAPEPNPLNSQVGGDHYSKLGNYQPWQVLAEWMTPEELRGFMKGTVIVYLARERDKGGYQDIEKALHTMQLWQEVRKDK